MRERYLAADVSWIEFALFLVMIADLKPGQTWSDLQGVVNSSKFDRWQVNGKVTGREAVRTPAGEFQTFRVELEASRPSRSPADRHYAARIQLIAWYAPEVSRVVKTARTSHSVRDILDTDRYELIAYGAR